MGSLQNGGRMGIGWDRGMIGGYGGDFCCWEIPRQNTRSKVDLKEARSIA